MLLQVLLQRMPLELMRLQCSLIWLLTLRHARVSRTAVRHPHELRQKRIRPEPESRRHIGRQLRVRHPNRKGGKEGHKGGVRGVQYAANGQVLPESRTQHK
jgi:hypothetical protein